jgi:hypothetical protein
VTMRGGGTTAMATAGPGEGCAVCGDLDGGWGRGAGGGSGACMHGECSELTLGTFTGMAILLLSIYVETMQHLLLPNSPGPAATCTLHTACAAHTVPSAHPPTATLLWRVCACMHQLPSSPLSHPPTQPTTIQSPSSHLHTHLPITHSPPPPFSPLPPCPPRPDRDDPEEEFQDAQDALEEMAEAEEEEAELEEVGDGGGRDMGPPGCGVSEGGGVLAGKVPSVGCICRL